MGIVYGLVFNLILKVQDVVDFSIIIVVLRQRYYYIVNAYLKILVLIQRDNFEMSLEEGDKIFVKGRGLIGIGFKLVLRVVVSLICIKNMGYV